MLRKLRLGRIFSDEGPKYHYSKSGPPIGGVMFIISIVLVSLSLSIRSYDFVFAAVLSTLGFGLLVYR